MIHGGPRVRRGNPEDLRIWLFLERALVFSWRQASALQPRAAVTTTRPLLDTLRANPVAAARAAPPAAAALARVVPLVRAARVGQRARLLPREPVPVALPAQARRAVATASASGATASAAPRAAATLVAATLAAATTVSVDRAAAA